MALTTNQRASNLFKKLMGVGETDINRAFFEEPYGYRPLEWVQKDLIPTTAPILNDGETLGIVQYFENKTMISVPGTTDAFYLADLVDSIPFNFGDGSYNYTLRDNSNNQIFFGQGDWVVDNATGLLYFYSGNPGNMPPKITFYKYIGKKGYGSGAGSVSYTTTFSNTDLNSGKLTIQHNLKALNNITSVSIRDNAGNHIGIDNVKDINTNMIELDLGSITPISGTWAIFITCVEDTGLAPAVPVQLNILNSKMLNGTSLN